MVDMDDEGIPNQPKIIEVEECVYCPFDNDEFGICDHEDLPTAFCGREDRETPITGRRADCPLDQRPVVIKVKKC